MKKAILAILLIAMTKVSEGQSPLTVPSYTSTMTVPSTSITRISICRTEVWGGTDANGNNVQYVGTWNGAQADSANASPLWRFLSFAAQNNLPITKTIAQNYIINNNVK